MKLTILGTGNATVTECYNTCFVISDDDRHFMVDGGGGNTILHQLKAAGVNHCLSLDGYERYFCDTQAYRPSSWNYLDDAYDSSEYE